MLPDGYVYTSPSNDYQSPGTDRVIFSTNCTYCAYGPPILIAHVLLLTDGFTLRLVVLNRCVTHTGAATYDGFVSCSDDV